MKHLLWMPLLTVSVLLSCSTDDKNNENDMENAIEGSWDATELKIDSSTASADALLAKQMLDYLSDNGCVVLSLTFNSDLTVVADNATDYVEVNTSAGGFVIPCPDQKDAETSTYTYEEGVLTIANLNGEPVSIEVVIQDDIMEVDAQALNIPEFDEKGTLVFTKR